jgi:hypothetical protein
MKSVSFYGLTPARAGNSGPAPPGDDVYGQRHRRWFVVGHDQECEGAVAHVDGSTAASELGASPTWDISKCYGLTPFS